MIKTLLFTVLFLLLGYFLVSSLIGKLILFAIFVFVLLFIFYSSKIKDEYGIRMIVGQIGVGKSSILCSLIRKYIKDGWNVYADFQTNIPGCRFYDPRQLDKFLPEKESIVICDEASLAFFNRSFSTFTPYTDFFAKCRHAHCRVIMSSQSFDVDLYIRNRTCEMYLVKRFGCISYMRKISKLQEVLDARSLSNAYDIKNSGLIDGYKYAPLLSKGGIRFYWLPALWKWHDSFYMDEKPELPYTVPVPLDSSAPKLSIFEKIKNRFVGSATKSHDDDSEEQLPEADYERSYDSIDVFLNASDSVFPSSDEVPRIRR